MKIRVSITVDIDQEAWAQAYGIEARDVRADVRDVVSDLVCDHLSRVGLLGVSA